MHFFAYFTRRNRNSKIYWELSDREKEIIKNLGFYPVAGKSLSQNIGGYMAGSADIRINDLHEAFSNPEIKAILFTGTLTQEKKQTIKITPIAIKPITKRFEENI